MKMLKMTVLTILLLAFLGVPAFAQNKVASVDIRKIVAGYYKSKQAEVLFEKKMTELRKELKDMTDGLDTAQEDYKQLLDQSYDQALSADERDKRKQAAADKLKDINNSKAAIEQFDRQAQSQVADSRQRINSNLLTDIQNAVADRAKAGGYTIVVNSAATDTIVYASTDNDLTDEVLKQLNAGAPIDVTPAAPPAPPILMSTNSMP